MEAKLTPWYPAHIKPVRVGVYENRDGMYPRWFRYWDGKNWRWGGPLPEVAYRKRRIGVMPDDYVWRGRARRPKGD